MSAVAESNEARPVTELKPPREKKITNVEIVDAKPSFKGLAKQIDELKVDITTMKKEKADARELAKQIKDKLMDRTLKEEQKKQLGKAIDGVQADIDRLTSELIALEMGYHQPRLNFPEPEEKKDVTKAGKDAWRKVGLEEVFAGGLIKLATQLKNGKKKGKADTAPILTLGDLSDFISLPYNKLTDINGIGPGAAEKIEAAMEKWWAAHPEMMPAKDETKPAAAETKDAKAETNAGKGETSKFFTPADLNLTAEQLDELCQPHLLVSAPYDPAEKIPDLHGCVLYQDKKWVPVSVQLGEEKVYTIHPLVELVMPSPEGREPDKSDGYFGRLVKLDGFVFEIASQADAIHVKVQKPADETMPLKEAMGKPKNKKGRNRRK